MKNNRSGSLDLLKFGAAIIIACFYHYRNMSVGGALSYTAVDYIFENVPFISWLSKNGWYFVEFFFIVSGMLAYKSYFNKIIEGQSFWDFYLMKCKRMLPLVFLTTMVMAVGQWFIFSRNASYWLNMGSNDLSQLVQHILGINIWLGTEMFSFNQPTWYISVCLFCYIIFYIITILNKKGNRLWMFFIPIYAGMTVGSFNVAFLNPLIARGLLAFFIGVILGIFLEKNYSRLIYRRVVIITLLTISVAYCMNGWNAFGNILLVFEMLIFPMIIMVAVNSRILKHLFDNRVSYFLGNISFGIYIWNIPIFMLTSLINDMFDLNLKYSSYKMFVFILIIHLLVATLSYEIIEKRIMPYIFTCISIKKRTSNANIQIDK